MSPLKHVYRCGCLRKVEISMLRLPGDRSSPLLMCPYCCAPMGDVARGTVPGVVRREER